LRKSCSIKEEIDTSSNAVVKGGNFKAKEYTFESMLQAWQSYCTENNTILVPKAEFKQWLGERY